MMMMMMVQVVEKGSLVMMGGGSFINIIFLEVKCPSSSLFVFDMMIRNEWEEKHTNMT